MLPATRAKLTAIESICIDKYNNIYIADYGNSRIRKIDAITKIITTVAGVDSCYAGSSKGTSGFSGDSGQATNAHLFYPEAIYTDTFGNIFLQMQATIE